MARVEPVRVQAYRCPVCKEHGLATYHENLREAREHANRPVFCLPNGLVYKYRVTFGIFSEDIFYALHYGEFDLSHNTFHSGFSFRYGDKSIKSPGQFIPLASSGGGDRGIISALKSGRGYSLLFS